MFDAGILTFQEFMVREPLPLATLQAAVLEFLQGRDDVVLFGAQAVNAYVNESRMTQDIDLLSTGAEGLAEELRTYLGERFHIAVRTRRVADGKGYRLFQVQKTGDRHLVDLRSVDILPSCQRIAEILVLAPQDLIAYKVIAYHRRRGQPKAGSDWRDIAMLLLTFPEFKQNPDQVTTRLQALDDDPAIVALWQDLARQEVQLPDEADEAW